MPIILTEVESSNIAKVGFDKTKNTLFILFTKGNCWKYSPMTENEYLSFLNEPSLGSFFAKHIKANPGIKAEKAQGSEWL
jgi:hypothetical protein